MKVISTEYSQILAARIASEARCGLVDVRFSRFPDGEQYLRAGDLGDELVVVGSVVNSDSLVQLLLLIDACEGTAVNLVLPYMGYSRQDKQFNPGEPLSARAVARALSYGVEQVITVNIHDEHVLTFFESHARNLTLANEIGNCILAKGLADPLILAPDDGAARFSHEVARAGGWDSDHLEKTRLSGELVRMEPKKLCAEGRDVVIVDDIISTGGTLATASKMLYNQGALNVYAACVHGILAGGAYGFLLSSGIREVLCSDTIERGCSMYSAAGCIATAIRR